MFSVFKSALRGAKDAYINFINLGTVEFQLTSVRIDQAWYQQLAIAGTNEPLDWWSNINLLSWRGYKYAAWRAAKKIKHSSYYNSMRSKTMPLIITGHSKAGATAAVFMKMFGNHDRDWCVLWNPCPAVRRWHNRRLPRTFTFINSHDIVSKGGIINFAHWDDTVTYKNEEDRGGVMDNHTLDQWDAYIVECANHDLYM